MIAESIHAYTEVLARYPGTPAANTAEEELLAMAESLEQQGRVHTALDIYHKVEQLT